MESVEWRNQFVFKQKEGWTHKHIVTGIKKKTLCAIACVQKCPYDKQCIKTVNHDFYFSS